MKKSPKTETIGAILRESMQRSSATVPDLIPQLSEYAKYLLAMRQEDAGGWDTRGDPNINYKHNQHKGGCDGIQQ